MDWKEITEFILRHYPVLSFWEPEVLENWVRWADSKDFLFLVHDNPINKQLTGLAIVRPMSEVGEYVPVGDKHDPYGQILYSDLTISSGKKIGQAIFCLVALRFGERQSVAFRRLGRTGGVKTYDFRAFRKTLLGR